MKSDESEPDEELTEDESSEADDEEEDVVEVGTDNVGDPSVEINVEELIHELEVQGLTNQIGRESATRRRLEELMEKRRAKRELEDFEDYDI
ncbi:MAG TPA: hypothetical protein VFV10_18645 [Gammaproteobacteria bacterium]|nr:hypothetical protein [Gammaproteobacteria bacterium]